MTAKRCKHSKVEAEFLELRLKEEILKNVSMQLIHEILDHKTDRDLRYIA